MLQQAPSCPECMSHSTRWLPATSDAAFVDYFRCDTCGAAWVVGGSAPEGSHEVAASPTSRARTSVMFLFVDIEAALIFASMAQETADHDRRRQLRHKAQQSFDAVTRYLPRVETTDDERARVLHGLNTLRYEIGRIPA